MLRHFLCTIKSYEQKVNNRGRSRGGAHPACTLPKIGKNMIFWRKIVIFHTKYPQKNVSAPLLAWNPGSTPWTMPSTSAYLLVIQVLDWDRHNNVAGVKLVKEIPTPPSFDNWISNDNKNVNIQWKHSTESLPFKNMTLYRKNEW